MLPKRVRNNGGATLGFETLETSLFGPQSQWSSLLGQRELLQTEITRGKRYLDQLRKDLAACGALVQTWPCPTGTARRNGRLVRRRRAAVNDSMEQFLSGWLVQLQERLLTVTQEIEALERNNVVEPFFPEESMYALLRAAG